MADKNNTALSLCVDKVLDHVGASEQIRRNHVERGMVDEVVTYLAVPIFHDSNVRCHNFGSWCEGTTTKGLKSDIDKLAYSPDIPAVEQLPDGFEDGLLIINDGTTKPGYVKLQTVKNGIPITSNIIAPFIDQFGRVCKRSNNILWERTYNSPLLGMREERRGPASTVLGRADIPEIDRVWAFRCYSIPSFTRGWIRRPRKYDWPSKQQLDKMSTYGCFLVGKGHPSSQTQHIEWRISFSFQERELMFSLNSTQHKCYILLKMIKQDLVSKMNEKSVSSYHLKTSLFYTIENNPTHIWIPDNLVYCTELCLKQLLDWLNNENCPNFFVPEENMFDRLSSDVMEMATTFIRDMLDSDGQYLVLLTCDKFGELLQESLSDKVLSNLSLEAIEFGLDCKMYLAHCSFYHANRHIILANRISAIETLRALHLLLEQLRKSKERLESERIFRKIKQGFELILPRIHLQIAQTIAAMISVETDAAKTHELMGQFNHHIEQANGCDIMSQRLIKASLLYKENKLEECERILADCETSLKDCSMSLCPCKGVNGYNGIKKMIEKGNAIRMSTLEFHRKYVAPCLMFLPSQADLAPTPLQYEMYRSVGADTDTVNPYRDYWFGVIAIDARLYLYFLQYLVCTRLNKHVHAELAKWKVVFYFCCDNNVLVQVLRQIGHLETCFNLLGWIFKHERDIKAAAICFYYSWKIRPDHNAAKWHMLVMMYEQYIQRSKK